METGLNKSANLNPQSKTGLNIQTNYAPKASNSFNKYVSANAPSHNTGNANPGSFNAPHQLPLMRPSPMNENKKTFNRDPRREKKKIKASLETKQH